jgi:hypothetical protein
LVAGGLETRDVFYWLEPLDDGRRSDRQLFANHLGRFLARHRDA